MNEEDGALTLISTLNGESNGESSIGGTLGVLEHLDGKQSFLIYSVKINSGKSTALRYAEILWTSGSSFIVYDAKPMSQLPSSDSANYGEINLSAAGRHALATF
jgi:hypothetical protein